MIKEEFRGKTTETNSRNKLTIQNCIARITLKGSINKRKEEEKC